MIVALAGAHGKIAMLLTTRLIDDGHTVVGLIRNRDHAADVRGAGATPVVCDLEKATVDEIVAAVGGADAAVFAAGAGPGSGAARKLTMDRDGAIKLVSAATAAGIERFVIVSSIGAESPPAGDETISVYLRAKAEADDAVRASDRDWTIIRPGGLTDDPGSGRVRIDTDPFRGQVPREDVAAVIARQLWDPRAFGKTLYINGGEVPIEQALDQALDVELS